jgi:hypothetical protein
MAQPNLNPCVLMKATIHVACVEQRELQGAAVVQFLDRRGRSAVIQSRPAVGSRARGPPLTRRNTATTSEQQRPCQWRGTEMTLRKGA